MASTSKKGSATTEVPKIAKVASGAVARAQKKVSVKKKNQKNSIRLRHVKQSTKNVHVRITDNTKREVLKPVREKAVIVRSQMQLALLSPFRFPMPREQFVGSVARYAGVFFVAVGAFFSLLNLPYVQGSHTVSQTAQTVSSASVTTYDGLTAPDSTDPGSIDTEPEPDIFVEGTDVLSGIVPITITVPMASGINLILDDYEKSNLIPIGSAVRIDASTWRYYLDTLKFPNGDYQIKTVIKNSYGSYDYTDSNQYAIENLTGSLSVPGTGAFVDAPDSDSEIIPTTTISKEDTSSVEIDIPDGDTLDGKVTINIFASEASEVKVYARNIKTGSLYYIGYGIYQKEDLWKVLWDTLKNPDGEYKIEARVKISGTEHKDSVEVSIENTTSIDLKEETTFSEDTTGEESFEPTIELSISGDDTLSGFVTIDITTSPVIAVEIFAIPNNSLTPRYIGLARKNSETSWKYVWDTKQSPNGTYNIFARVKSVYGVTDGEQTEVYVSNDSVITFTEAQEKVMDDFHEVDNSLVKIIEEDDIEGGIPNTEPRPVYIQPVSEYVETVDVEDEVQESIAELLHDFRDRLDAKLNELARARRTGDEATLLTIQAEIEDIKQEVLNNLPGGIEKKEIIESINKYLSEVSSELQELTLKNEMILKERVGDVILADSDKDGVSDYDEINLYQTNPFSADTDGDGYIDSAEITLGYDPLDSSSEAYVTYESPKETGIIREDILVIDTITTLTTESDSVEQPKKALLSGKGLPNSFVTLYIFSTPIVVTVKTDADGGWSYVFDKELEEGAHEVYVGITDNAGRVVAKSNPLSFVKTAEAFTASNIEANTVVQTVEEPSLIPPNIMLLVASIAVVALGLILILLGLHMHHRQPILVETKPA